MKCSCGSEVNQFKTLTYELSNADFSIKEGTFPICCLNCKRSYNIIAFDKSYDSNKPSAPKIITFPACQGKVSNHAKSCPHCGKPINTQITCPKCSADNNTIAMYCKDCGTYK